MAEIKPSLPEDVSIVPTYGRSELIKRAIATRREKFIDESTIVIRGLRILFELDVKRG